MLGMMRRLAAGLSLLIFLLPLGADAQTSKDQSAQRPPRDSRPKLPRVPSAAVSGDSAEVAKMNEWTIGLASGLLEGTFIRFGAEMARALNDGDEMRILPIVSPGANDNVKYLLYVKGVDVGLVHSDQFEYYRTVEKIPNIEKRINYISPMYISEIHFLARPEINSLKDLEGKKVSFHQAATGPQITGPIIFARLGIKVEPVTINNALALEKMKTGEIAALLHTVGKPNELFRKFKNDYGFKFLPVPFEGLEDYYVPSVLTAEDYPGYIKPGEKVNTIGVQAVLAVYNWPRESDRYRRVARFIDLYFDNLKKFQEPPYHPAWRSVNLAATVPGWNRYWAAEEKLKRMGAVESAAVPIDLQLARQQATRAAPNSRVEQERLFQQFLEWSKIQGKR
jgi:TRAP-type uncharacterized transport system substrate-binding protein